MSHKSRLLRIPEGLLTTGDPVDGNPFNGADPRHQVWEDATLVAEAELCRFNSDYVADVDWQETGSDLQQSLNIRFATLACGKFDIWAKRGVHVVWGMRAIPAYDEWLVNYAEEWLKCIHSLLAPADAAPSVDEILRATRLRLIGRIEWWKAEARRYVREQRAATNQNTGTTVSDFKHSDDYRSITAGGVKYALTTNQALVIEELHRALQKGLSGCSNDHLLERLGNPRSRVRDSFKGGQGPAIWKNLISKVKGSKNMYCLKLPASR